MKRLIFLSLILVPFFASLPVHKAGAQTQTDAALTNQINSATVDVGIRGKTYSAKAAANMFKTIVDSKVSQFVKNRTVTDNNAIVQNDQNGIVVFNSPTAINFTINSLVQGTTVNFLNKGVGAVTFVPGSGVTIVGVTLLSGGSYLSGVVYFDTNVSPVITTNEGSSVAGANRELQLNNAGVFGGAEIFNDGNNLTTLGNASQSFNDQTLTTAGTGQAALTIQPKTGASLSLNASSATLYLNGTDMNITTTNTLTLFANAMAISPISSATYTGTHQFENNSFRIRNPSGTFSYINVSSPITANRNVTLPLLTADDVYTFQNFAQTLTNKTLSTGTTISAIPTISAGIKITTSPNATNAGLNTGSVATDPTTLANGDIWYNSTSNTFNGRINAATQTFATLAGTQTFTNKTLSTGTTISAIPTISAGIKITTSPNATNAGLNTGSVATDPTTLANGDIWYNSTSNALRGRINGVSTDLTIPNLFSTTVTISSAQLLSSFTTPIQLVPAQGAGNVIIPVQIVISLTYGGTAYTGNTTTQIQLNGTNVASVSGFIGNSSNTFINMDLPQVALGSASGNVPLNFTTATGNPSAGNGTLKVFVLYRLITL